MAVMELSRVCIIPNRMERMKRSHGLDGIKKTVYGFPQQEARLLDECPALMGWLALGPGACMVGG